MLDTNTYLWLALSTIIVILYIVLGYNYIRKLIDESNSPANFTTFIILVVVWIFIYIIDVYEKTDWSIHPRKKE